MSDKNSEKSPLPDQEAERQVWKNERAIKDINDNTARIEKDLDKLRESFEDYKEKRRDRERENSWNFWHIVALFIAAIIGGLVTLLTQLMTSS